MMTNKISLYYHIPFCVRKCAYCAFYSFPCSDEKLKSDYADALIRQTDFFADEEKRTVSTVYFGGGTPPVLGVERLCLIASHIKEVLNVSPSCEITAEVNPGTVGKADLEKMRNAGINRLSVGVQSDDDDVLKALGRIHTYDQAEKCISDAFDAGFENVNADVIFALPFKSEKGFSEGLRRIADTGVTHISAYSLQLEEGTRLYEYRKSLDFPSEDEEENQYEALCALCAERGFEHYEVSAFAKRGFESRHNLNYWACGEYFGFGAGAHSFYRGKRFHAEADARAFIEKSGVSLFAPTNFEKCECISPQEAKEERIMLSLRTSGGVIIPDGARSVAERISKLGYGKFDGERLVLNEKGFRVSNEIISEIILASEKN